MTGGGKQATGQAPGGTYQVPGWQVPVKRPASVGWLYGALAAHLVDLQANVALCSGVGLQGTFSLAPNDAAPCSRCMTIERNWEVIFPAASLSQESQEGDQDA